MRASANRIMSWNFDVYESWGMRDYWEVHGPDISRWRRGCCLANPIQSILLSHHFLRPHILN